MVGKLLETCLGGALNAVGGCGVWLQLWCARYRLCRLLSLPFERYGLIGVVYVLQKKKEGITWMRCIRLKTC